MSISSPDARNEASTVAIESIQQALNGLRYGTVTVVVHDGAVVQVDRTEKLRLSNPNTHRI